LESHIRSVTKALSWRLFATVITFFVSWLLTEQISVAVKIGLLDTIIKLAAYYSHERLWMRVKFGKIKTPEYEI
jgi:uncharacterized membrane protein